MSSSKGAPLERARRLASSAHVLAIVAVVLLALMIVMQFVAPAGAALLAEHGEAAARLDKALRLLIPVLPLALFVFATLTLRKALEEFGDGGFFSARAAQHVARAGAEAGLALLAQIIAVPTLQGWVEGKRAININAEPLLVAMLAFALAVMLIGRVLRAAAELKRENDAFV